MGKLVEAEFKMPDLKKRFNASQERISRFIAAQIQTNRGMMFDKEGAYNGHQKWAPLKYREGQILKKRGDLSRSIGPQGSKGYPGANGIVRISGTIKRLQVSVGTSLKYAAMMNWGTAGLPGGVLVAKTKKCLRFKVGNKWVMVHSVKIPARRFDGWNEQDKQELSGALRNLIVRILNGG